jgi:hypothetical protein
MLITVAEIGEYQRRADKLLSNSERQDIVNMSLRFRRLAT